MLTQEEKELLQAYIDSSQPGMAYRRRAQIILLSDEGIAPESIASELTIPVGRVRQFIRVFNREHLNLFPPSMFTPPKPFSPDDSIAEAGRMILAVFTEKIQSHGDDLRQQTDTFSVHETRKACRRLRTALQLFTPFFEPELLGTYRRQFHEVMRRLARSRDIAVFMMKFESYRDEVLDVYAISDLENQSLAEFEHYWRDARNRADDRVREYVSSDPYLRLLEDFNRFAHEVGEGVLEAAEPETPLRTRFAAPILLYQKAAAVRAYDGFVEGASLQTLHHLRIQCKKLRYSIEFFLPVLGPTASAVLADVKSVLIHLGDLNDARIALRMMDEVEDPALAPFIKLYRQ
ncbi:MAG: CHAD domain-containing protein, partial [Candidatus Promineifilaceae bacterium]